MSVRSYSLARELGIDHGTAVMGARAICPSGWDAGEHGSTCPCDDCTVLAIRVLAGARSVQRRRPRRYESQVEHRCGDPRCTDPDHLRVVPVPDAESIEAEQERRARDEDRRP